MVKDDDLVGQRFFHLSVIRRVEDHVTSGGHNLPAYECVCDCGKHKVVLSQKLRRGLAKSCGQCGIYKDNGSLIGRRFNHLVVVARVEDHVSTGGNKFPAYDCICDCGNHKVATAIKLKTNRVKSCGKCGIYSRKKDLTGMVFDKLTVISENGYYEYPNGERDYKWLCKCECGNLVTIRGCSLKSPGNHNCGCYRNAVRVTDDEMIGRKFGLLTVVERADPVYTKSGTVISMWRCICDCDNTFVARGAGLRNGRIKSCGCTQRSLSESLVEDYLLKHGFVYETSYKFDNLLGVGGQHLSYDFKIDINGHVVLIELQGGQHYFPVDYFGGETRFEIQQKHDALKKEYAENNGYDLVCINCHNVPTEVILNQVSNFLLRFQC